MSRLGYRGMIGVPFVVVMKQGQLSRLVRFILWPSTWRWHFEQDNGSTVCLYSWDTMSRAPFAFDWMASQSRLRRERYTCQVSV